MSGKRVLWRDRSDERVRERRRRQGRVMAAMAQAAESEGPAPVAAGVADVAARGFDLASWLMMGPAGEARRPSEAPLLEP